MNAAAQVGRKAAALLLTCAALLVYAACGGEDREAAADLESPTPSETQTRMVVDSVRVDVLDGQRIVILRTEDSERFLPIWIGPFEAQAIAVKLGQLPLPRPMTHDLLTSVISDLQASVDRVVVTDIADGIFYAGVFLTADGKTIEIDARPSDAIALALRVQAPIYVKDAVLDAAAVDTLAAPESPLLTGDEPIN